MAKSKFGFTRTTTARNVVSPEGFAGWCYIKEPYEGENQRRINAVFDPENPEFEGFYNTLLEAERLRAEKSGDEPGVPGCVKQAQESDVTDKKMIGWPMIQFRTSQTARVVDGALLPLEEDPWKGDTVRVQADVGFWEKGGDSRVKCYLIGVQLLVSQRGQAPLQFEAAGGTGNAAPGYAFATKPDPKALEKEDG